MSVSSTPEPRNQDRFAVLVSRLSESKIPGLDGVRAIAISLVVIFHLHFRAFRNWEESLGRTGVTLFFVLSGFLITWLLLKENDRTANISLWNFYVRRFLRIFPGFYVFWMIYVGLALLAHKHVSWGNCIAALFYLNNYYWPLRGGGEGGMLLTWSLGVEEQFYLIWPSIFKRFRASLNTVAVVLAALCGLVLLHRILLLYSWHINPTYLYTAFDARMDSLATGCLLAISIRTGKARRFVQWVSAHTALPLATIALFALSMAVPSMASRFPYWNVEGFTVESALSAILIVQMVVLGRSAPWKWINWGWVRFIGMVSYSWYLYNAIGPDAINHSPLGHTLLRAPAGLLAGLALASASYYVVEKPFLKLKSKYEVKNKRDLKTAPADAVLATVAD
jgi:peptidoglycan/LPS O-acetylase OafA/YrhL